MIDIEQIILDERIKIKSKIFTINDENKIDSEIILLFLVKRDFFK